MSKMDVWKEVPSDRCRNRRVCQMFHPADRFVPTFLPWLSGIFTGTNAHVVCS